MGGVPAPPSQVGCLPPCSTSYLPPSHLHIFPRDCDVTLEPLWVLHTDSPVPSCPHPMTCASP